MPAQTTAASLFRDVGLLADGPTPWGRPAPARGRGVFVVELPGPLPAAPIEMTAVGKWLEHVPTLRLDGERPSSRALAARLSSFWWPSQVVLYVGAAESSLGRRIAAIEATVLGDRRPHSGGHWLRTLRLPSATTVWWASTDAVEEYEDALLAAFASGIPNEERAQSPDQDVILPFANLRRPTGERRRAGLSGSLLTEPALPPRPTPRVVIVPDGDAEGARGEPPTPRRRASPTPPAAASSTPPTAPPAASTRAGTTGRLGDPNLTAAGAERMRGELDQLVRKRPDVVARIRSAKELGDLKENADYAAAREEQSFLEGRIQALERRLRDAVIAEPPERGAGADLGSVVTVEVDGDELMYALVGSAESDAGAGRLSIMSPVGRALVGTVAGAEVIVQTPRGPVRYRVVAVT